LYTEKGSLVGKKKGIHFDGKIKATAIYKEEGQIQYSEGAGLTVSGKLHLRIGKLKKRQLH